ncbi:MAG: heavy metal translocating P-type ATPase, partial [Syntrophobacteraceae bacterium]|nr:heavy metal translocating P-type ATPase [Syntrophobacteraceae bacterium]
MTAVIAGKDHVFCCHGCSAVYRILDGQPEGPPRDFKETEIYRTCLALGLIAGGDAEPGEGDPSTTLPRRGSGIHMGRGGEPLSETMTLEIDGMWCTACSWIIEKVLSRTHGVLEAQVSFPADLVQVRYLPQLTNPGDIRSRIVQLGYGAVPVSEEPESRGERERLFLRLGVSLILTANVMMISFALYTGFFHDLGAEAIHVLSWSLLALATPVLFYGGLPIFKRALWGIRHGILSVDTLIAVGSFSAYALSLLQMREGTVHLYFDTAAMLITVVLLGRTVESWAKERVSRGVSALWRLAGGKVRLVSSGAERWVATETVDAGTEFLLRSGERSTLDGVVARGTGRVDTSVLTGEPVPVAKGPGDPVMAGSLVLDGELEVRATRPYEEGSLQQMINLILEILAGKSPHEMLADRITKGFVPAVLLLSLAVLGVMTFHGASTHESLLRALTVLVITCPCALGVATPLAKIAAVDAGRKAGVIIRDHQAFECVKDLRHLVFDKTGTLTEGKFTLTEIVSLEVTREEALRRVASIEARSDHFLSREILEAARGLPLQEVLEFRTMEGMGICGVAEDGEIAVGNRSLMETLGLAIPIGLDRVAKDFERLGSTVIFFAWERGIQGLMRFDDVIRESGKALVSALQQEGISVWLASGDSETTVEAVAKRLGIQRWEGSILPPHQSIGVRGKLREHHATEHLGITLHQRSDLGGRCDRSHRR